MPEKPSTKPPTPIAALQHFRWIQRQDAAIGVLLLLAVALSFVLMWRDLSNEAIISLLASLMLLSAWVVILMFRSSWFVLLLMARCKNLPNITARHALAYVQKKAPDVEDDDKPPPRLEGSHLRALIDAGWLKPVDGIFALASLAAWACCAVAFYQPDVQITHALFCGLMGFLCMSAWALVLAFRCSWFVLQLSADVRQIPSEAMKLIYLFERRA